jgi:hypothetical protein
LGTSDATSNELGGQDSLPFLAESLGQGETLYNWPRFEDKAEEHVHRGREDEA